MPDFVQLPVQLQIPYDDPEDDNVQFDEEEEEDDAADVADVHGVNGNRNQDFLYWRTICGYSNFQSNTFFKLNVVLL